MFRQEQIILWLLIFAEMSYAQNNKESFEQIGIKSGLTSNYINAIIQDDKGFIWAGTNQGLNRYDGYQNKTFTFNSESESSLSNNWVTTLIQGSDGNIWIGTEGGGLNKYIPDSNKFVRYRHSPDDSASLSSDFIKVLFEDSQNRLWVGTQKGLGLFDTKTETYRNWNGYLVCETCEYSVTAIAEDHLGNLWIADELHGLYYFNPSLETFSQPYPTNNALIGSDDPFINGLIYDGGLLWIGTDNGLILLNTTTQKFEDIKIQSNVDFLDSYVMSLYQVVESEIWICTKSRGLINYTKSDGKTILYSANRMNGPGLSSSSISDVLIDAADNLWIATVGSGLNKYNLRNRIFHHFGVAQNNKNTLANSEIRAIHQDVSGEIWLGTNHGVSRLDVATGEFRNFISDLNFREDKISPRVRMIARSANGQLWVGTQSGALYNYDNRLEKFNLDQHYMTSQVTKELRDILCAIEPIKDVMWFGTGGTGFIAYDLKTGKVSSALNGFESIDHNSRMSVYVTIPRSSSEIWAGTDQGLLLIDLKSKKVRQWQTKENNTKSLIDNKVRSLYQDNINRVWIGTRNGLSVLNLTSMEFSNFGIEHGLSSEVIFGILPGTDGNIWLSTAKGLTRVDPQTMSFKKIVLPQNETLDMGAYASGINGNIIVGGPTGFTYFNPQQIVSNKFKPNVVLTELKINYKNYETNKSITELDTLILPYDQNNIAVQFSSLDFTNPDNNKYKYKLEGQNTDWIENGTKNDLTFTNLDPGDYTLYIKGSNSDGEWNTDSVGLFISIKPPWWGELWFRISVILGSLILLIGFYRLKMANLRQQRRDLEEKVVERTLKLKEINDQLETQNKLVSNQKLELEAALDQLKEAQSQIVQSEKMASVGVLTAGVAHEINNPLNYIQGGKNLLKNYFDSHLKEHFDKLNPLLEIIQTGLDRSTRIVRSLNRFSRHSQAYDENVDMHLVIQNCLEILRVKIGKDIKVDQDLCVDQTVIQGNEGELHQLITNLITNSLQAMGTEGTICMRTRIHDQQFEFVLTDTGSGIPEEIITKITEPFFTTKAPGQGTGLGLSIAYAIVQRHHGKIRFESQVGIGTSVKIELPAHNASKKSAGEHSDIRASRYFSSN